MLQLRQPAGFQGRHVQLHHRSQGLLQAIPLRGGDVVLRTEMTLAICVVPDLEVHVEACFVRFWNNSMAQRMAFFDGPLAQSR